MGDDRVAGMVVDAELDRMDPVLSRAQGCLLGQLAGDALGSLVEFQSPDTIAEGYPGGVRELRDGGVWGTLAGQPTDDSEMALLLARMLVERGAYDPVGAQEAYLFWIQSNPFDCGGTISSALRGRPLMESQANGAMMRVSPLGIFGANYPLSKVAQWAQFDAAITHPNPVCLQANGLFTMAIAYGIQSGVDGPSVYQALVDWAEEMAVEPALMDVIRGAAEAPPHEFVHHQGWVLIAFQNALWQLIHAPNLEEGVVDTIMRGGDTDTNAAICGALLGAVYGRQAVPEQWVDRLLCCRPQAGLLGVRRPRPEVFWPVDALQLAERLVTRAEAAL